MKITINRNAFKDAIDIVKDTAAPSSCGIPVIRNLKLETHGKDELTITATNLDQTVSTKVKCSVVVGGETTMPSKMLPAMVGALTSEQVDLTQEDDGMAIIKGGDVKYKIVTIPAKDFPKDIRKPGGVELTMKQGELKNALVRTAYAASQDDTRRVLQSVCLQADRNCVIAVATDGRRLAVDRVNSSSPEKVEALIPIGSVKQIVKMLKGDDEIKIVIDHRGKIVLTTDKWTFTTKLIADNYPKWTQIVPKDVPNRVTINRELLIESVRQMSICVNSEHPHIKITIESGKMTIIAVNNNVGDAETSMPVNYDGEKTHITLNPRYILEALTSLTTDEIDIRFVDGNSPIVFGGDDEQMTLMMPMRIA